MPRVRGQCSTPACHLRKPGVCSLPSRVRPVKSLFPTAGCHTAELSNLQFLPAGDLTKVLNHKLYGMKSGFLQFASPSVILHSFSWTISRAGFKTKNAASAGNNARYFGAKLRGTHIANEKPGFLKPTLNLVGWERIENTLLDSPSFYVSTLPLDIPSNGKDRR